MFAAILCFILAALIGAFPQDKWDTVAAILLVCLGIFLLVTQANAQVAIKIYLDGNLYLATWFK